MSWKLTIVLAGAFATRATLAHGILGGFITDGVSNPSFETEYIYRIQNGNPVPDLAAWSTESLDRGYIEPNSFGTLDMICHKNAVPGVLTAKVASGGTVDFFWPKWPHNVGPVLTYIAPCGGDCASVDKSTLRFTKIDEAGYDNGWAGQKLMDNNFTWTTTVPSTIAPGNYVFRHEIINLHSGAEANGAQNYPQCVNIEITGSGTDSPAGVLGVDLYKADDAGILFDPYADTIDYPLPGPALYVPGSGSDSTDMASTAAASTAAASASATALSQAVPGTPTALSTTVTPVVPTSTENEASNSSVVPTVIPTTLLTRTSNAPVATTAPGTDSGTVRLYGQCGGKGYTGPTKCKSGTKCEKSPKNPLYYSKCVPA
ncbi:glycosyl hydrolase family 61-domain-containing protein [Dactylonectria estremocensis]|uniref:lytic cellulose monooxygenase (C4-dehydrogenating) n=1 Tax=Dactylonectria estremocensis TaxID=1079267 RepID=A0A9P9ILL1_9HYPO|nr:glycosyl hydrolase family 61-domain-containing protein [Dactylonectria estremocensis]